MLKRYLMTIIVTSVLAVAAVVYMYSKNYIVFESGIHIVIPSKPNHTEKYVEREFEPANVQPEVVDTNLMARVETITPSNKDTKVDEPRLYDDVMKAAETFMPLLTIIVPIYLHTKNKKKRKADDE